MDRNLGAMNTNNPGSGIGSIWYQFGRKDPFEGGTLYDASGNKTSKTTIAWDATTQELSKKGKNVPYSVQNPMKFITGSTWTIGDIYCPIGGGDFMWQDPKSVSNVDGKVKKSIFDPCPSGWMVPLNSVWSGISMVGGQVLENGVGRYYYPDKTKLPNVYVFYPSANYLSSSNGAVSSGTGTPGWCWSISPNAESAFNFWYRSDNGDMNASQSSVRANGYSVRCIQEYF